MATQRYRCGVCGRSRPEDETTTISGRRSGDYRTATRRCQRRVCRDCTVEHIDFTRKAQGENRGAPLDDHYHVWHQAADAFGIDVSDLWRNDYDRRKRAEESGA